MMRLEPAAPAGQAAEPSRGGRTAEPVLSASALSKAYGPVQALQGMSLSFAAGEVHAIAGQNGAGKSTFVRILSGAERPDGGTIRIAGVPVELGSPHAAQQAGIITIYQELSLVPRLSVAENIFLGDLTTRHGPVIDWRRIRDQSRSTLAWLGFDIDVGRPANTLSVAQQQAVELAKALRRKAKVILLDEPTATLPAPDVKRLIEVLKSLRRRGIVIIYVSHRLEELYELCERVSVLRDGQLVGTYELPETGSAEIIRAMIGRALRTSLLGRSLESSGERPRLGSGDVGDVAMRVHGLQDRGMLRDISLEVRRGEVVGITGLVGSGQSELAGCLFGARERLRGRIEIGGRTVRLDSPREAIRHGIGLLPQDRKTEGLIHHLPVAHNISLASLRRFSRYAVLHRELETRVANDMIAALSMRSVSPDKPVGQLSGGTQQKVVLAKWLVSTARILIFDEPTRGIDVGAKEEIYELISKFVRDGGAVIMFSSELAEVMMCDRILVMARGRLVGEIGHADVDPQGDAILDLFY